MTMGNNEKILIPEWRNLFVKKFVRKMFKKKIIKGWKFKISKIILNCVGKKNSN